MRIAGVNPAEAQGNVARIFADQTEKHGAPFSSSRIMARRPSILVGQMALSQGIEESGLIPTALRALLNRRVASHNDCPF